MSQERGRLIMRIIIFALNDDLDVCFIIRILSFRSSVLLRTFFCRTFVLFHPDFSGTHLIILLLIRKGLTDSFM